MTDYETLARRVLGCESRERRGRLWCETHDEPWECPRATEVADELREAWWAETDALLERLSVAERRAEAVRATPDPSAAFLARAQEWLTCQSTGGPEAYCLRHGSLFIGAWPCEDSQRLAAVLARADWEARAEGAADGIEGLMHELACHRDAELAARRADQWRAQARATGADQ